MMVNFKYFSNNLNQIIKFKFEKLFEELQEMFYATQDGSKLNASLVEKIYESIEKVIDGLEDVIGDDTNESFGKYSNRNYSNI